jgi:hypothetical protein
MVFAQPLKNSSTRRDIIIIVSLLCQEFGFKYNSGLQIKL